MPPFFRKLARRIEAMWWRKTPPPYSLQAISSIYSVISKRDQRHRIARQKTPPLPLISIGNITVGGSGKTPFVIWLSEALKTRGYEPVILCRGDGGSLQSPTLVQPDMPAQLVGDEARLLADDCHCPVISGRDRVHAASMAPQFGNVILLDDGFQYRELYRDCDIVLIPSEGLGNAHLIPAGPLREPEKALERADLIVRTGAAPHSPLATQQRQWQWQTHISQLDDGLGSKSSEPKHVAAVSAIARPERFHADLARHGCIVDAIRIFPDHHRFSPRDIEHILSLSFPVAVTTKDAVKLKPLWPKGQPLWIARQQVQAESGLLDAILNHLQRA